VRGVEVRGTRRWEGARLAAQPRHARCGKRLRTRQAAPGRGASG
jgi:hypothetical protein